jgi:SHAQKYF class myb-like DNA-binding protein
MFTGKSVWFLDLFSVTRSFDNANAEAAPKKILQMMDVDYLTRENVASHLQV